MKKKICGIVMPISTSGDLDANHWVDVKSIIEDACSEADFEARLVSDTFESNLIHKEILQNIYKDDILVVDVSSRNPNVFFELGIRMATQKPTVIVKDNKTTYPFDTGPNRYIEYPRDLRHPAIEKFKAQLVEALKKTIDQPKEQSFIGQLGPFQVPDVESTSVPAGDVILERLERIEQQVKRNRLGTGKSVFSESNRNFFSRSSKHTATISDEYAIVEFVGVTEVQVSEGIKAFTQRYGKLAINEISRREVTNSNFIVRIAGSSPITQEMVDRLIREVELVPPF